MAQCDYCGSTIMFGGRSQGDFRFCNEKCEQRGALLSVAAQIPDDMLAQQVAAVHEGACPKCGGVGPIDVQTSYTIWSALLVSSWRSRPEICCRSCGVKAKLSAAAFSGILGWWGFPWGFLVTPVQVIRNLTGLLRAPDPREPSKQLRKLVALQLAAAAVQASAGPGETAATSP